MKYRLSSGEDTASQLGRFSIVGAIGFVVDTAVLYVLIGLEGFSLLGGRLGSYLVAATTTWALNRAFTFRGGGRPGKWQEWARYLAVNGLGGAVNYAVYAALVLTSDRIAQYPVLGVAAGSIAGLLFNFTASRTLVFRT